VLNVPLTVWPSAPTMATTGTMIKANITAYSTAVGPSSLERKRLTREGIAVFCTTQSENVLSFQSEKNGRKPHDVDI